MPSPAAISILRPVLERLRQAIDPVGLGVLAGALALFVPLCGAYGLWDPWETHYAEAARQILERGDYVGRDENGQIVMTLTMDDFLYDELCLVGDDGDLEDDRDMI